MGMDVREMILIVRWRSLSWHDCRPEPGVELGLRSMTGVENFEEMDLVGEIYRADEQEFGTEF